MSSNKNNMEFINANPGATSDSTSAQLRKIPIKHLIPTHTADLYTWNIEKASIKKSNQYTYSVNEALSQHLLYLIEYRIIKLKDVDTNWLSYLENTYKMLRDFPNITCLLGIMYLNGIGVTKNYKKGVHYLHIAAEIGNEIANLELSILYTNKASNLRNIHINKTLPLPNEDGFVEGNPYKNKKPSVQRLSLNKLIVNKKPKNTYYNFD